MEPAASHSRETAPAPDAEVLAALLECEADLDALERALLAAALAPLHGAPDRVWLLRHDDARGLLVGWRVRDAALEPEAVAVSMARARRAPPVEDEASERLRAWAVPVEQLTGACEFAWRTGLVGEGSAAEPAGAPWEGCERIAVLPLRRGVHRHGVLVAAWRAASAATPRLEPLRAAADAAFAAHERASELRRRQRQTAALAEFAHAAVSAANVAEAMHRVVRLAAQALQARHAAIFRMRDDGSARLEVTHGPAPARETQARTLQGAVNELVRQPRALAGVSGAELPGPPLEGAGEIARWALQPAVAYGRLHGVLAVWDATDVAPAPMAWERGDLDTLAALADQTALLLEHARRLGELESAERRRGDLAARLREQDQLAAVGELAARVADEARDPLASLRTLAARALGELADDDPRRAWLELVQREAERVEALLREQSEYARLERPRLALESLNTVVQEALRGSGESLSRRRVRLVKKLAPDLPELLLDAARIRRVVSNLVACALESLPTGGRMRVETRRAGAFVVLEVLHDRAHANGEVLEQLFAPFGAAGPGAAVGLGVAQQIVREHGGEIRVRSEEDWASVFAVTLPVLENRDRRAGLDRRSARSDRRRRAS